jgi:hypothetical protein
MNGLRNEDIKAVVLEALAEQQKLYRDEVESIVLRTVATTLTSFGINEDDRRERVIVHPENTDSTSV